MAVEEQRDGLQSNMEGGRGGISVPSEPVAQSLTPLATPQPETILN